MRKFMKIVESITHDFDTNQQIEAILGNLPKDQQNSVLDGLEMVYNSPNGLSVADWMRSMKTLVDKETDLHALLAIMVENFRTLITRDGDTLSWRSVSLHNDEELDMSDPLTHMAKAQIEYTNLILDVMRNHGQFSQRDILTGAAAVTGLDPNTVQMLVQHIIDTNGSTIRKIGPDRYEMVAAQRNPTPSENMAMWRDLAARGGVEK